MCSSPGKQADGRTLLVILRYLERVLQWIRTCRRSPPSPIPFFVPLLQSFMYVYMYVFTHLCKFTYFQILAPKTKDHGNTKTKFRLYWCKFMLQFESDFFFFLVLLLLRPSIDSRRSIPIMKSNVLYSKSTDLVTNFMLNIPYTNILLCLIEDGVVWSSWTDI